MFLNPKLNAKFKSFFSIGSPTPAVPGGLLIGGQTPAPGGAAPGGPETWTSSEVSTGQTPATTFEATCPPGKYAKEILSTSKASGILHKRFDRVSQLGLKCTDNSEPMAIGLIDQLATRFACPNGFNKITTWYTKDTIQKIIPFCDGSQVTGVHTGSTQGQNDKAIGGSQIGSSKDIECPPGMVITGVAGRYDRDPNKSKWGQALSIAGWKWTCGKKPV